MPLFAIIGHDVADSTAKRSEIRPSHLERLNTLDAQNRLVLAGPMPIEHDKPAMSGSLIVAHFDSLAEAQAWVNDEPYLTAGVYSHMEVRPFVQGFPKLTIED
ncbi:MAG: YciI family protein [Moraxella sp.]|nr:YciI family protein [Moraxella sp.]